MTFVGDEMIVFAGNKQVSCNELRKSGGVYLIYTEDVRFERNVKTWLRNTARGHGSRQEGHGRRQDTAEESEWKDMERCQQTK